MVPPLPPVLGGVIVEPPQPVTPITFGTGPDSLVLEVCDDAYADGDGTSNANGDATFTISIDGKQIGGTFTTIASHAAGQDQDLTLNGQFGPGSIPSRSTSSTMPTTTHRPPIATSTSTWSPTKG